MNNHKFEQQCSDTTIMKNNGHHKDLTIYDPHIPYILYNRDRHLP